MCQSLDTYLPNVHLFGERSKSTGGFLFVGMFVTGDVHIKLLYVLLMLCAHSRSLTMPSIQLVSTVSTFHHHIMSFHDYIVHVCSYNHRQRLWSLCLQSLALSELAVQTVATSVHSPITHTTISNDHCGVSRANPPCLRINELALC